MYKSPFGCTTEEQQLLTLFLLVAGPLCSVLVNRFGCRPVMMVGGLFASLGMILASFSTSIIHIYLTTGVITGEAPCRLETSWHLGPGGSLPASLLQVWGSR